MDIEKAMSEVVEKYNKKFESDKDLKEKMKAVNKRIVLEITGDATYRLDIVNGKVAEFAVGDFSTKDLTVTMDKATYEKLHSKALSPFQAYAEKRISFSGNLADLLVMKGILMD